MPSRWDLLLDQKPIPIVEHLLEEVAKLLVQDLQRWPLPVEELDLGTGREFASLFEPGAPKPPTEAYEESFRLARWELERETAAYDEYMRNRRWLERGLAPEHKRVLLLVSRWLVEQMLALGEATEGRIKRREMVDCLDRAQRRFAKVATA